MGKREGKGEKDDDDDKDECDIKFEIRGMGEIDLLKIMKIYVYIKTFNRCYYINLLFILGVIIIKRKKNDQCSIFLQCFV